MEENRARYRATPGGGFRETRNLDFLAARRSVGTASQTRAACFSRPQRLSKTVTPRKTKGFTTRCPKPVSFGWPKSPSPAAWPPSGGPCWCSGRTWPMRFRRGRGQARPIEAERAGSGTGWKGSKRPGQFGQLGMVRFLVTICAEHHRLSSRCLALLNRTFKSWGEQCWPNLIVVPCLPGKFVCALPR